MNYKKIEVETRDSIGIIRLNDPERLNAVTTRMLEEVDQAIDALHDSVSVLILTGTGRGFCAGAALDGGLGDEDMTSPQRDIGMVLETHANPLMLKLRNLDIPWISAVRGAVAGFGVSLALAADLVVASETAYFLQAFALVGLVPDGGCSHLLVRTIGRVRAMELMLLGDRLPAQRACDWGLVNRVVADGALEDEALKLARRLSQGAPVALGLTRKMAWSAVDAEWEQTMRQERDLQRIAGRTQDFDEGVAAFREKRPASFSGK